MSGPPGQRLFVVWICGKNSLSDSRIASSGNFRIMSARRVALLYNELVLFERGIPARSGHPARAAGETPKWRSRSRRTCLARRHGRLACRQSTCGIRRGTGICWRRSIRAACFAARCWPIWHPTHLSVAGHCGHLVLLHATRYSRDCFCFKSRRAPCPGRCARFPRRLTQSKNVVLVEFRDRPRIHRPLFVIDDRRCNRVGEWILI